MEGEQAQENPQEQEVKTEEVSQEEAVVSNEPSTKTEEVSENWEERWSNTNNRIYFLNTVNSTSQWDRPASNNIVPLPVKPVRASHLLVKHVGSRRPSSWKQEVITRSLQEAIDIINSYREKLLASENLTIAFKDLATTESDCSSAKNGGDLGYFGGPSKVRMQEEFDKASFALEVGELSLPIESASGVHLILRTA